jgi:phage gpG-like protein
MQTFESRIKSALRTLPRIVGNEVVNFALDNFKKQGFLGDVFEKWPARKNPTKWGTVPKRNGRALLVNSGRLRRGGRIVRADWNAVVYGNDVPYARAHNDGLRIGEIQRVQSFSRKVRGKSQSVSAFTRHINQNIPRRRFIGNSQYLTARLKRVAEVHILKNLREWH